ncbi:MAG TPA: DUF1816 domain-containing protein [Coleofasciculaceae cyanobacterium]
MNFSEKFETLLLPLLEPLGLAWWVEVNTAQPCCTYYFGPFATAKNAKLAQFGYLEDLAQEGSQINSVEVRQCQPKALTIASD